MPTWQYTGTDPYRFENRFGNNITLRNGDTIETYTQNVSMDITASTSEVI